MNLWWLDSELQRACGSNQHRRRHWRDGADDVRFAIEVVRRAPKYAALLAGRSFRVTRAATGELTVSAGVAVLHTSILDSTGTRIDVPAHPNGAPPTLAHARDLLINDVSLTSKGDRA